jgi:hypothetical protein
MSVSTRVREFGTTFSNDIAYGFVCGLSVFFAILADRQALWTDEEITHMLIERWGVWEILTVLPLRQPHLPTYYLIPELLGWEVTSLVSLVALPATVFATIRAAEALYDDFGAAYLAGTLTALSPFLATQAGWQRMYAPLTAAMTVGLWLGLEKRYRLSAICMFFASILHVFGAFGVLWLALTSAKDGRDKLAALVFGLGSLPGISFVAVNHSSKGLTTAATGMGHGIVPSLLKIALTPVSSLLGSPHNMIQIVGVLAITILILRPTPDWRVRLWILLPVAGIVLGSWAVHPVFRLKYFGFVAPAVAIVAASPRRKRWHAAIILLVVLVLLFVAWMQRAPPHMVLTTRRFIFWNSVQIA